MRRFARFCKEYWINIIPITYPIWGDFLNMHERLFVFEISFYMLRYVKMIVVEQ